MVREWPDKLKIELYGDPNKDVIDLNGEPVEYLTGVDISVNYGMGGAHIPYVTLHRLKLPSAEPYTVEGYLVNEEEYEEFRRWQKERIEESLGVRE